MADIYKGTSQITGPLVQTDKVYFKSNLTIAERSALLLFLLMTLLASASLSWYVLGTMSFGGWNVLIYAALFLLLLGEAIRLVQSLTLLIFALNAKDPIPMTPGTGLRVAVLTTIVPGKEPLDLVLRTLKKMKTIDPGAGNTMDVWLLDEGNDPEVKAACEAIGVKHFSRKGVPEWNTESGPFKAKTKHGNHNSWRAANEADYDVVAQMDPDHIPRKNFLTRTLGYFKDEDVAFVVAPQVYGNLKENWIARASAFQAYVFHGVIQRGGNGMNAPLLIGTNHLYRVKAFRQIGGYQDSIIEDHLTSMIIYATKNDTGNTWKGVYTPDILAVGEGPTSFTDYFNQQKRWAYGIWEIALKSSPRAFRQMNKLQALTFTMLQFFYPSVAVAWVASFLATVLFSTFSATTSGSLAVLAGLWLYSVLSTLWLFFWLRRFNLVEHERKDWGIQGMGLLMMCIPVYVSAAWEALTRKKLTYAVTAKGDLASPDNLKTFQPHINWILLSSIGIAVIYIITRDYMNSGVFWSVEHIAICTLPLAVYFSSRLKSFSAASAMRRLALRFRKTQVELQPELQAESQTITNG